MYQHHNGSSLSSEPGKAKTEALESTHGVATKMAPNGGVDAGLRSLDHYKRALPKWRYTVRQVMLPLVRWETPYVAYLQKMMRTPFLDSYFAITANLGTHTFFMICLPMLFWYGFTGFGKGLVHILAEGVLFTGFIKDMCSLPRPLSPPLHRITMSGSAALEYGFPSTHSANAVSVTVYTILVLHSACNPFSPGTTRGLEMLAYFYAFSIVFGRLYCGMHGFLDVIVGSVMGAVISLIEFYYGPSFDEFSKSSGFGVPLTVLLLIIILVRIHPEPVDDCPCFDDSVAFAGVIIGLELGTWHMAQTQWSTIYNGPDASFDLAALGWVRAVLRLVVGVLIIFLWREAMKPALLKTLPHLFRVIETHGLSLPRRFFMQASQYKNVPLRLRDDNVLPSVSDIPRLVQSIRGPCRGRSVSIGPQSAADAYETLAYRERRRRESMDSNRAPAVQSKPSLGGLREKAGTAQEAQGTAIGADQAGTWSQATGVQSSRLAEYENMMGRGTIVVTPASDDAADDKPSGLDDKPPQIFVGQRDELGEKEMFSQLVKPRVRYDVEVVTKLVVYTGIGMLATDLIPIIFELSGTLGSGHLR